jgi:Protein of unknown function (DUF3105)
MAKKKQRKRTGPGRAGAGAATATSSGRARAASNGPEAASPVKPAPASPGGPNRQERKEAARLARERLRRKAVRQRLYRRAAISLVVVGLVGGVVLLATRPKSGSALNTEEKQLLAQAPAALTSAGCGAVETTKDYPDDHDRTHIGSDPAVPAAPPLSSYPSVPPASGPHNPATLPAGVYSNSPPVDQAIHSLEHAAVIIWYSPTAASDPAQEQALAALTDFFRQDRESAKVIVAPYDYPDQGAAGQLPDGKGMVVVSWHHLQLCDKISLPVAYDFVAHYRFPAPKGEAYKGTAPEPNVAIG